MAAKARQQYYADGEYIDKQAREFQPTMEFKTKIDSIEPGAQVNIIEDIKVNGTSLEVDDKTVDISIPLVIDNLYSTDGVNALSAKQGKVLYDLVQNLASRGRYLSNWNAATGLPTTNPVESHYQYRAGDYYVVSSVAAQGGTNYRPEPGEFIIGQASVTVETEIVKVTDMYLYDGTNWNLLINSTREIAIDSSLSTSSTNPVENRVVTNAINGKQDILVAGSNIQIASDGKTISATDTTYTAGTNVSIDANNEISAVDTTYTAGANVQISNENVISATDTTYAAGDGIDITNNEISVDASDLAGTGLSTDNNNNLIVDTTTIQEKLVSGTNIKTVNNNSLLGSGNIDIPSGKNDIVTSTTAPSDTTVLWIKDNSGEYEPNELYYYNNEEAEWVKFDGVYNGSLAPSYFHLWYDSSDNKLKVCDTRTSGTFVPICLVSYGQDNDYGATLWIDENDGYRLKYNDSDTYEWQTIRGPYINNSAPFSTDFGEGGGLWVDTSGTYPVIKYYDAESTTWKPIGGVTYTAGDGIDINNGSISVDVTDIIGTGLSEDANNNIIVDTTVVATQTDLSGKQDKATSGSTAPSTTPSYVGQQYVDTTNDKMYVATGTSSSSDWTEVGAGSGDMLYSDFNWVTKTGATITLDLRSEITPSTDFTVNKPSTLEDGQYYILRVISGATAYTMTLGTNVTNPYSEDLTLEASTVQQFTFLAKGGNLELQPSSEGVVYTAGTGITISNDEISADTTVLATKTDLSDLNTKTFYLSSTSDLTTATAALQWYFAGKNAIIVYRGYAYTIGATTSSSPLVFISTIAISRSSSSPITENWVKNLQIFFNSSHNATVILDSSKYNSQSFIETNYNYSTPYTPQYDGSPATKKYVDDNVVQKSATAPSSPVEGTVWYDTTNDILKAYDGTQWNVVGNGDMAYADFNWVTKTGATVTLDFNSVIEPSANFTVNAPSTIKDGQIYILRVESGATAYTMTLGTGITNPYSESTTLTANKIKLFTFLAIDGNLELQPSVQGGGIISSNNTYEDIVYLSQSAYDALATKDPNTLYSTPEQGEGSGYLVQSEQQSGDKVITAGSDVLQPRLVYLTRTEYENLPSSKLTDGIDYVIIKE